MGALEIAEEYFAAWNAHDPKAVAATFAKGGAYRDPVTAQDLSGDAIADYAAGPFEAFPDLSFEAGETVVSENTVAAEWVMRGTNTGPLRFGLPPTNKTIALPGSDLIEVGDNGISAVRGYFDQKTFVEQLGLQAMAEVYSGQLHLTAANTAIWVPHRINALLLRCTACEALTEASETQSKCACGAELPDPPPYW